MKKLLIAAIILIAGCKEKAIESQKTTNTNLDVDLLFEKDGIKVYRFYDYGRAVYFTDARGRVDWSHTETYSNGKTTTTVTVPDQTIQE